MGVFRALTTARARRAVVGAIAPLVESSKRRLGTIAAASWREPYMLGFVSMLISLMAKCETRNRIGSEELGTVQCDVWQSITGLPDDRIGEDICLLSAEKDREFLAGCFNACRFIDAFHGLHDPNDPDVRELCMGGFEEHVEPRADASVRTFGRGGNMAAALWTRYFDDHLR
jgi:hypothetical protein